MATATGSQFTFAAVSATIGLIVALGASPASAAPAVDGEFAVSGVGTDNTIVKGPDGNVWVTLESGDPAKDWARITPRA